MATPAVRGRGNSFRGVHEIRALPTREPISAAHRRSGRIRGLDSISEARCSRYTQRSSQSCLAHFRSLKRICSQARTQVPVRVGDAFSTQAAIDSYGIVRVLLVLGDPREFLAFRQLFESNGRQCHIRRSDQETAELGSLTSY